MLNHPTVDQVNLVAAVSHMVFEIFQPWFIWLVLLQQGQGVVCLADNLNAVLNVIKVRPLNIVLAQALP